MFEMPQRRSRLLLLPLLLLLLLLLLRLHLKRVWQRLLQLSRTLRLRKRMKAKSREEARDKGRGVREKGRGVRSASSLPRERRKEAATGWRRSKQPPTQPTHTPTQPTQPRCFMDHLIHGRWQVLHLCLRLSVTVYVAV